VPIWLKCILGILWVGGGGIVFLLSPAYICRIFGQVETAKHIRRIRLIGVLSLGTVAIGLVWMLVLGFFSPDSLATFLFSK